MSNSLYRKLTTNRENYITTLSRLFDYATTAYAKRPALTFVDGSQSYTYAEFRKKSIELAHLFSRYGLNAGDRIAILSQNMPNWTVSLFSIVAFGRVAVPILPDSSESEVTNILNHSECKAIFVSQRMAGKLSDEVKKKLTLIIDIDTLEIIQRDDAEFTCDGCGKEPSPDDLAMIIYTSGTSGRAKGVMLSHKNLASDAYHSLEAMTIARDTVAVLPFNHTFGFLACVVCQLWVGYSIFINSSLKTVLKDIQTAKPGHISVVPLFVENFYKNIWKAAERQGKKKALEQLIKVSNTMRKAGVDLRRKLFKSVWDNLGGRLELIISGGAPIDHKYIKGFDDLGITVINGYGITECSPIVSINRNKWIKYGSVGQPIPTVSVKIHEPNEAGEGEILVKGDIVMQGYYNDPEATAAAMTDGWFNTGDIGTIDADGFLYITGRKKNLIILENGKNVYPEELEALIGQIEYVTEVLVYEDGGLITAEIYTEEQENKDAAKDAIKKDVQNLNKTLAQYKQIRKIKFRAVEFEKTTTKKIKRF